MRERTGLLDGVGFKVSVSFNQPSDRATAGRLASLLSAMHTSHLFTKQITEAETGSCQIREIREIRDRERVMRGLKTAETPIIPGYQIYHNYLRPNEALEGKTPKVLITDGLPAYHDAYMKEYWANRLDKTTHHIRQITLTGKHNNNKMERMNGEVRDREKVMRGIKKPDTPILTGYQIFHNYIRPHEALEGKTPAEAAGINVEGENKWITLIQNASRKYQ